MALAELFPFNCENYTHSNLRIIKKKIKLNSLIRINDYAQQTDNFLCILK
jgi:hypothetical protein